MKRSSVSLAFALCTAVENGERDANKIVADLDLFVSKLDRQQTESEFALMKELCEAEAGRYFANESALARIAAAHEKTKHITRTRKQIAQLVTTEEWLRDTDFLSLSPLAQADILAESPLFFEIER